MDKYLVKVPAKAKNNETPKQKIAVKKETPKEAKMATKKSTEAISNKRKNENTPEVIKDKENTETENPPKRRSSRVTRSTRSMAEGGSPSPVKEKPEKLPFIKYKGAIKYYTESQEIAASADEVMQWVDKQKDMDVIPMAFDMEWPFSFQTGPGKSAVIQICVDETCCYVYQLTNLKKIPAALMALINHPKVRLHGVNIKADFRKLQRDFPEVSADALIAKCVDLGVWCNEICETGGRWSLERLANFIARKAMDKSKKVRMSKWHVIPLDENQLMYAAIDVYIGQVIYRELDQREKAKAMNEEEFIEKNGDAAFKAVKALGENFLSKINEVTL
ncbi:hypothetical protein KR044_009636 [Drosophila immigrans]|nr:hypothetical protein KR044_009636 [Drosophila immigrans]